MATRGFGIRRIVVGVDGSAHSKAALEWAIRMAKGTGSEVIAVCAISPPLLLGAVPSVEIFDVWGAEFKKQFEEQWTKPLRKSGVRFRTMTEDGRPASVIGAVADRNNADMIVVGRRGRGGVAELLLGSVSHEVVLHSKRPVLVISATEQPVRNEPPRRPVKSRRRT